VRRLAAAFAVFGAFWGGWAVAAADVERSLHLSHAGFGLLLSAALGGAALTNAIGGALVERHGTASMFPVTLAGWAVLLVVGAAVRSPIALGLVIVLLIASGGFLDVVMNVAATAALANEPGELVRFHARFNVGAAIGAACTGVLLANGASWRWQWAGIAAGALLLATATRGRDLPAGEAGEHTELTSALSLLRRERLVLIALAFAVGAMVEGGIDLWGVLFLRTFLSSGIAVAATSSTLGFCVAAAARVFIGPRVAQRGAVAGTAAGGVAAGVGVLVLALARTPWLSGVGLVLAAGGISMCWPLLLAYASAGRSRPGLVVGGMSGVGYLGFVVGPTLVGWLAAAFGLRWGLLVLATGGLFVAVAPLAHRRAVSPSRQP
jgi:MFS family permease